MKKLFKRLLQIILILVLIVVGYLGYVLVTYDRLEDNIVLTVDDSATFDSASVDTEYTIISQNIGFGAYCKDFTFFMDGGVESRARSEEVIYDDFDKCMKTIKSYDPDIVVFQEVDTDSDRSLHIDERELIRMDGYNHVFANNYHSAYLMYPVTRPHGASKSGISVLSRFKVNSALRRSIVVSDSFSKLLDLDRCFSVNRISVDNGKELVVFNAHMSAYGGGEEVRIAQISKLMGDMKAEYDKGNYVICGGDFNSDFTGDSVDVLNPSQDIEPQGWMQPFLKELIPEGIHICTDYTCGEERASCRNCDLPYEEGNFTIIVDGFFISDNVEMTYLENVQTGFEYSDHNPVVMKFVLKG